jgi:phosphoribosylaminoimidazolecarboxamide formyltransferase/IMP cyclohydrolase
MEFADPACVIIKHLTPCGIATADNIVDAYKLAYESDTVSAFGSIIAVNRGVDVPLLEAIGSLFLEVLVARSFTNEAVEWLSRKKKNCRVMRVKGETRKDVVRFLFVAFGIYMGVYSLNLLSALCRLFAQSLAVSWYRPMT